MEERQTTSEARRGTDMTRERAARFSHLITSLVHSLLMSVPWFFASCQSVRFSLTSFTRFTRGTRR